eukprot:s3761_g2.t2
MDFLSAAPSDMQQQRRDSAAEQEAAIRRIQAAQRGVAIRRVAEAQENAVSEEEQRRVWAATKIQSLHRGRTCRQQLPTNNDIAVAAAVNQEEESAIRRIQAAQRAWVSRQQVIAEQDKWAGAHHQDLALEKSSDSSRDVAALKIQALQRGRSCRQQLAAERAVEESRAAAALKIQSLQRGHACRQQLAAERAVEESRAAAVLKIQSLQRGCACRRQLAAERAIQESREAAALKIQSLQRGRSCRQQVGDIREERAQQRRELAAAKIQALQRGRLCRLQLAEQKKQAAKARAIAMAKEKPFSPSPSSKKPFSGRVASPPPRKALPEHPRSGSRQRTPLKAKTPSFRSPRSAPSPAPKAKAKASPSTPRSPPQPPPQPPAAQVKEPKRLLGCQQLATYLAQQRLAKQKLEALAIGWSASTIQACLKTRLCQEYMRKLAKDAWLRETAAVKIQAWYRRCHRRQTQVASKSGLARGAPRQEAAILPATPPASVRSRLEDSPEAPETTAGQCQSYKSLYAKRANLDRAARARSPGASPGIGYPDLATSRRTSPGRQLLRSGLKKIAVTGTGSRQAARQVELSAVELREKVAGSAPEEIGSRGWDKDDQQRLLKAKLRLTPLGNHLAQLPVDAGCAKLLVLGCIFGVPGDVCTLAAALSVKSPFAVTAAGKGSGKGAQEQRKMELAGDLESDQLVLVKLFEHWERLGKRTQAARVWCRENGLDLQAFESVSDMRRHLMGILVEQGFSSPETSDDGSKRRMPACLSSILAAKEEFNRRRFQLLRSLLCAALWPNALLAKDNGTLFARNATSLGFHSSSVLALQADQAAQEASGDWTCPQCGFYNFASREECKSCWAPRPSSPPRRRVRPLRHRAFMFGEKVRSLATGQGQKSQTLCRDCCGVSLKSLFLLGHRIQVDFLKGQASVDGWIHCQAAAQDASMLLGMRRRLQDVLSRQLARKSAEALTSDDAEVVNVISQMLVMDVE